MRAARIHSWGGQLRIEQVAAPEPGPGEVLVRVEACSVGLTVLNMIRGDLGAKPEHLPRIPGHEFVGKVVGVGAGIDPQRLGQTVGCYSYLFCGSCDWCLRDAEPLCRYLAGMIGVDRDGGYAEFAVIPDRNAVALPAGIDPVLASAIPDAVTTPVHVASRAEIRLGERVVVIGAGGGVGIHMLQVARLRGAEVLAVDVNEAKLAFIRQELGFETASADPGLGPRLPSGWSREADVVIDFVGSASSLVSATSMMGRNGRLVLVTTFPGITLPVLPRDLVFWQGSIMGSRYASRWELELAAQLVAAGRIRPIVSQTVALEEIESLQERLRQGSLIGRGAIVF